ncbi:hypothetical protein Y032_0002g1023 [Ancylostoma ceylanicum]|uniref:Uncharacterized protein n=1 Tax=Ancylostoma ceylanicum TaxID=53326 RepID=A0A016W064_9BILA|nr:hypothetical protein Y032_0002g1023 [Ancylostoma ceylanicum]
MLNENGYTKSEPRPWRLFFAPGAPLVLPYVNEENVKDVNSHERSEHTNKTRVPTTTESQKLANLNQDLRREVLTEQLRVLYQTKDLPTKRYRISNYMSRVWKDIRERDVTTSPQAFGRKYASAT